MKKLICFTLLLIGMATPIFAQNNYDLMLQALKANDDRVTHNKEYRMSLIDWIYKLKDVGAADKVFVASIDKYLKQLLDMKPEANIAAFSRIEGTLDDIKLGIKAEVSSYKTRAADKSTMNSNSNKNLNQDLNLAYASLKIKDYKTAYQAVGNAILTNPSSWEAYMVRGLVLNYGFKQYNDALADFTRSINIKSNNVNAYYYRAECYENIGNLWNALKDLDVCIEFDKSYMGAFFKRGIIKSGLEDNFGAINDYDVVINNASDREVTNYILATSYNNKGYCYVKLKKYSDALPLLNKALEINDKQWFIWDSRGETYYWLGEYKKCIEDMSQAIILNPHAGSFYFRGLSRIKMKDKAKACTDFNKAWELGEIKAYNEIELYCK